MLYWLINVILCIFNKRLRNFEMNKMKLIDFDLKLYGNYIIFFFNTLFAANKIIMNKNFFAIYLLIICSLRLFNFLL